MLEYSEIARNMNLQALRDLRKQLYEISYHAQCLDLRGANIAGVDLTNLPLDTILLQDANLIGADLRKSLLHQAHVERAMRDRAFLQELFLAGAHLEEASLDDTHAACIEIWKTWRTLGMQTFKSFETSGRN